MVELLNVRGTVHGMAHSAWLIISTRNSKPSRISGGQRQRIAFGRAIVRNADVFLMDEPLSNLDAKLREHMRVELVLLHQSLETTSIYVTHDQTEAMTMSTKTVLLDQGKIQWVCPPTKFYEKPLNLFVAGFIGSPTMNIFHGEIKDGNFHSLEEYFVIEPKEKDRESLKPFEGKKVAMGIKLKALLCGRGEKERHQCQGRCHRNAGQGATASLPVPEWQGVCHFRTRTP
jgi:multiple sugar transport system ATP-binding protein